MLSSYGEQLIHTIRALCAQEKYDDAWKLIEEEYQMPYMDPELDEQLQNWLSYLQERCGNDAQTASRQYSDKTLQEMLKGSIDQQTAAVLYLSGLNLRQKHELIQQSLLEKNLDLFARGYLIHVLNQQENNEVYKLADGSSFVPSQVILPGNEAVVPVVLDRFDQWFGSSEPSMKDLCTRVLQEELYRRLPDEVPVGQAEALAASIAVYVLKASGRDEEVMEWLSQNSRLQSRELLDLRVGEAAL